MTPSTNRKVGRPTAAELRDRGDGRRLIDMTALRAFSELGFHRASVRDIARTAGVSMSAMYHYYPSKQVLLFSLLQQGIDEYHAICGEALANAAADPLSRFDALVAVTIEYRATHKVESNLMLSESRNLDEKLQDVLRTPQEDATARFNQIIAEGLSVGVFSSPYPDDARRAVQSMCNSIAQWYDINGAIGLDELIVRYQHLARALVGHVPTTPEATARRTVRRGRTQAGPG